MDELGGLFSAIKWLIILIAIIAVPVVIISLGIQYWPITIIIIGGAIAGFFARLWRSIRDAGGAGPIGTYG